MEKELQELILSQKIIGLIKPFELYELTQLHPISPNTMKRSMTLFTDLKSDDRYYYNQFKREQKEIFHHILTFLQDLQTFAIKPQIQLRYSSQKYSIKALVYRIV